MVPVRRQLEGEQVPAVEGQDEHLDSSAQEVMNISTSQQGPEPFWGYSNPCHKNQDTHTHTTCARVYTYEHLRGIRAT
jgi:hypothetical protein